ALIPSEGRDAVVVRGSLHEAGAVDLLKANYRDAVKVSKASSGGWLIAQIVQCRQTDRLCDKD
ncbi:MAG: hypothetical protein AAFQ34_15180, partial [Pseudomonadota bacterium]